MNNPRKPWLAVILTFFSIGLGHIYNGEAQKGISLFFLGYLFLGVLLVFSLLYPPVGPIVGILVGLLFVLYCLYDSYQIAKRKKTQFTLKKYNRWYLYIVFWLIGGVVFGNIIELTLKANLAQAYKIPSGAMLNTLQIGDNIICNKLIYKTSDPKRGDVVIFPYPKDPSIDYAKRIIGLPGERIEIKEKTVLINGLPVSEPYTVHTTDLTLSSSVSPRDNMPKTEIPSGKYFLMGDNRDNSSDSRFWGFVDGSTIKGKVIYTYWSWDSKNSKVRWSRIGKDIE